MAGLPNSALYPLTGGQPVVTLAGMSKRQTPQTTPGMKGARRAAKLVSGLLTVRQAAERLGMRRQSLLQAISEERLAAVWCERLGQWLITPAAVAGYQTGLLNLAAQAKQTREAEEAVRLINTLSTLSMAADKLALSRQTLRYAIGQQALPAVYFESLGVWLIPGEAVAAYQPMAVRVAAGQQTRHARQAQANKPQRNATLAVKIPLAA